MLTQKLLQTPPQQQPPVAPPSVGKHVLPNGVRLRLALTTVINDLFARQAPLHRHSHGQAEAAAAAAASSSSASRSNSGASSSRQTIQTSSSSTSSPLSLSWLPQSLVPLLFVSCAATAATSTSSPYSVCFLSFPLPHIPHHALRASTTPSSYLHPLTLTSHGLSHRI